MMRLHKIRNNNNRGRPAKIQHREFLSWIRAAGAPPGGGGGVNEREYRPE